MQPNRADDSAAGALKRSLLAALNERFSGLFTTANLALMAAALHPRFGHLEFVRDESVRASVWERLATDAKCFARPNDRVSLSVVQKNIACQLELVREEFTNIRQSNRHNSKQFFDAVEYWRQDQSFTSLHRLARMILAIPATSAASERLFSSASFEQSSSRALLSNDNLAQIVFIREAVRGMSAEDVSRELPALISSALEPLTAK